MGAAEVRVGRLLIIMFIPQMFFYGVIGTATAVMNSRRRFALAAGAPAVENLGTIAVLVATAVLYGTGAEPHQRADRRDAAARARLDRRGRACMRPPSGGVHGGPGWCSLPRPGWRDARSGWSSGGRCPRWRKRDWPAIQMLTLLIVANRLPGGVVAFQIALNFYYLAIAWEPRR